jgi:cytochrome c5
LRRLLERSGQRVLPLGRSHARGVAPERGRADAAEALLAGLAAAAAAQRLGVPILDPACAQCHGQGVSVELRIPSRAWEPADVDHRLDVRPPEQLDQLL